MKAQTPPRTVLRVEDSDDGALFFERSLDQAAAPAQLVRLFDGRTHRGSLADRGRLARFPGERFQTAGFDSVRGGELDLGIKEARNALGISG